MDIGSGSMCLLKSCPSNCSKSTKGAPPGSQAGCAYGGTRLRYQATSLISEPHDVMVARRTVDDTVLRSLPAPTAARGYRGPQVRQSEAVVPLPPGPVLRTQRDRHDRGDQRWSVINHVGLSAE